MDTNMTIALLLEDEPLIAMDIELALSAGFQVATVMSCTEASDWLDQHTPDIAIVDIILRDGSCHEVVERLIARNIPFVVHSGDHPSQYENTPFVRGAWLGKPARPEDLIATARALTAS